MANFPFFSDIDLNNNQLFKSRWENLSSAPSSPGDARFYFDTTTKLFRGWNGTNWSNFNNGFSPVSILTISSGSTSIDLANATMFAITLNQNTTITSIAGIPSGVSGIEIILSVTQDGAGNKTLAFPSGTTITGSIDTVGNSVSIVRLISFNAGTTWNAIVISPAASGVSSNYWTPNNLTTRWWLKASDSSSIQLGSGVSQWNDKKGNGSTIQGTASAQPAYISNGLNGKNVVRFDGGDTLTNAYDISNARTIAMVFKQNSPQNFFCGIVGGNLIVIINSNNICLRKSLDASIVIDSSISSQQFNIVIIQIAPNNAFLRVNGTLIGSDTSYNSFSGSLAIGGGGEANIAGDIAELIITESVLTTSDTEKLEGYLASAQEWSLQSLLPSNHPYKSSAPMV